MTRPVFPPWLIKELRADHAGETGAVWIYRGVLAVSRSPEVVAFAVGHLATEGHHLREIERVLEPRERSRMLAVWRVAGWLTGALPALVGPDAVFQTVAAVETFVDQHYRQQIERLSAATSLPRHLEMIRAVLVDCRSDEIAHRDEALALSTGSRGLLIGLWCYAVAVGSEAAVKCARVV